MHSGACPDAVDDSFGPSVVGCRQDLDLTLFFEGVFLAICPSITFQICSAFRIRCLFRQSPKARRGFLWLLKLGLCLVLIGVQISTLVVWALHPGGAVQVVVAATALGVLDAMTMLILSGLNHTRSIRPSTILQLYLLVAIIADAIRVRTLYLQHIEEALSAVFMAGLGVKSLILILETVEKRSLLVERPAMLSQESTTSFINRCVFWWLNDLLMIGRVKTLDLADLDSLDAELGSAKLQHKLQDRWRTSRENGSCARGEGKHWLLLSLVSTLKWQLAIAAIPRAVLIVLRSSQPFLVERLLNSTSVPQSVPMRNAWILIPAFALVYLGIAVSRTLSLLSGRLVL